MVARVELPGEAEVHLEFWEKVAGEVAGFRSDLLQRYNPTQPVSEGPSANTSKMTWVDAVDLPRFEEGVAVAVQVARPPLGWTGAHALARCCIRAPSPSFKEG